MFEFNLDLIISYSFTSSSILALLKVLLNSESNLQGILRFSHLEQGCGCLSEASHLAFCCLHSVHAIFFDRLLLF